MRLEEENGKSEANESLWKNAHFYIVSNVWCNNKTNKRKTRKFEQQREKMRARAQHNLNDELKE